MTYTSYKPSEIEPKWQKEWEKSPYYKAEDFSTKTKFYALTEFPYPSGDGLHMGHTFMYTIPDIYARKKRMEGFNVMFPMGWDAFGLPTENYAVKTGVQPALVTKHNTDNFRSQMKSLAFSFDWDREINTTDPNYFKWTQWIFLQLFKHGLAYKSETPVGWCPSCKIVLAKEEIVNDKCERCGTKAEARKQNQWVLRITSYADRLDKELDLVDYPVSAKVSQRNWIGKKVGRKIKFGEIEIFTTRPETILGATFVVLSPNHPRAGKVKTVINPATKEEIPVFVDEYVLDSVGTGAIMGVPAFDERDLAFAKKMNLPVKKAEFTDENFGTPVTIYHLRDWIFSRQHYWGEPIPMIYCQSCAQKGQTWWQTAEGKKFRPMFNPAQAERFDSLESPVDLAGWFPVSETELPLKLPEVEKYQPTDTGESPLANIKEWVEVTCPECGETARRETDTMPNWAGSSWYYLRYADSYNNNSIADANKLDYWQPVDVYFGGAEHTTLHLLYSRFWHKFLNDLDLVPGKEPYKVRIQHGIILAENGSKMSKSKGNVINPDEMVKKFGADAVRMYVSFIGPYDQTMPWNTRGVGGISRFLSRVWKIYGSPERINAQSDSKLLTSLSRTVKHVGEAIDNLKHNTAIASMMAFINEWEGGMLDKQDASKFLTILAPFAPHLTEELWHELGNEESIHLQSWPKVDETNLEEPDKTIAVSINGKTRGVISLSAHDVKVLTETEIVQMAQSNTKVSKLLVGKEIKRTIYVPGKILNFVV